MKILLPQNHDGRSNVASNDNAVALLKADRDDFHVVPVQQSGGNLKNLEIVPANADSTRHSSPACYVRAFTLLEVMIACGVFFIAIFAILGLVSNLLRNAQYLRHVEVDAGLVAAQLFKTNIISEGVETGDFGDKFRGYSWRTDAYEAETNGLWQIDITVLKQGARDPVDKMSVWMYSPQSSQLPFGGGGQPTR
jgi:hypothetical protein